MNQISNQDVFNLYSVLVIWFVLKKIERYLNSFWDFPTFTYLTELMSIIIATISIFLFPQKPRDVLAFETLQTFDGIFKKFWFKVISRHFNNFFIFFRFADPRLLLTQSLSTRFSPFFVKHSQKTGIIWLKLLQLSLNKIQLFALVRYMKTSKLEVKDLFWIARSLSKSAQLFRVYKKVEQTFLVIFKVEN